MRTVHWLAFELATPAVFWAGWPLLVRGWQPVRTGNPNRFALIGLGVSLVWAYSLVALVAPQVFPASMQTGEGLVAVYFKAAAVVAPAAMSFSSVSVIGNTLRFRRLKLLPLQQVAKPQINPPLVNRKATNPTPASKASQITQIHNHLWSLQASLRGQV